jgi:hypothetical protein
MTPNEATLLVGDTRSKIRSLSQRLPLADEKEALTTKKELYRLEERLKWLLDQTKSKN